MLHFLFCFKKFEEHKKRNFVKKKPDDIRTGNHMLG